MDRTLYSDGTVVSERQLTWTEDTRVYHILNRFIEGVQTGVVSGLEVTVNPVDANLVDIAVGTGFAPNGEFIEVVNPINQVSMATSGDNVVGLVYTEVESEPKPHETNGTAPNSRVTRAFVVSVLSGADYDALPTTSEDLSVVSQDRFMPIAVVNNVSSPLEITLPPAFDATLVAVTQPTIIPGVVITNIDPTTAKTDPSPSAGVPEEAELTYDTATGLSTYKSPFDSAAGPSQNISGGGTFTLASTNGQTLTIEVVADLLPQSGGLFTDDTLVVTYLYDRTPQRVSARDEDHRHIVGDQNPTTVNPHGLRLLNIATLIEYLPGFLELGTQLDQSIAGVLTPRLRIPNVDFTALGNDFTYLWDVTGAGQSGGPFTSRWYASEFDSLVLTVNAKYFQDSTPTNEWRRDTNGSTSIKVEISNDGFAVSTRPASVGDAPWADSAWEVVQFLDMSTGLALLQCGVAFGEGCLDTEADVETARIATHFSKVAGRTRTLIWTSRGVTSTFPTAFDTGESTYNVYRVSGIDLNFGDPDALEIVRNAVWDESTLTWSRVGGAAFATKLFLSTERIAMFRRTTAGAWADSAWDTNEVAILFGSGNATFTGDLSASDISAGGNLTVAGTASVAGSISGAASGATALNIPSGGGTFGENVSATSFTPTYEGITGTPLVGQETYVLGRLYSNLMIVAKATLTFNGSSFVASTDRVNVDSTVTIGAALGSNHSPVTITFPNNVGAGALIFLQDASPLTSSRALMWHADQVAGGSATIYATDPIPATESGIDFNAPGGGNDGITGDTVTLIVIRSP